MLAGQADCEQKREGENSSYIRNEETRITERFMWTGVTEDVMRMV